MNYNLIGISINNFRVFGKETNFKLLPITILTGTNSSGKSSLTKTLKLLVRSFNKNGLRNLELMDLDLKLGGFQSLINSYSKRKTIEFKLEIAVENRLEKYVFKKVESKIFSVILVYNDNGLAKFSIYDSVGLLMEQEGYFGIEYKQPSKSFLRIPETILNKSKIASKFSLLNEDDLSDVYQAIMFYLQTKVELHNISDFHDYISASLTQKFDLIDERITRVLSGISHVGHVDKEKYTHEDEYGEHEVSRENIVSDRPTFNSILPKKFISKIDQSLLEECFTHEYLLECPKSFELFPKNVFSEIFSKFEFIEGVRATQEILYTQTNNPEFYLLLNDIYNSRDNEFINGLGNWLVNKFGILKLSEGESFSDIFKIQQVPGIGYHLAIYQGGINLGLAGLGYGITQLLPIILKLLIYSNSGKTFVIEEPESNLHPALQSQLTDYFITFINGQIGDYTNHDGQKVRTGSSLQTDNNRLVIETHSEYLIRKLQYSIAKRQIASNIAKIYYFNRLDNISMGQEHIKNIDINNDGSLSDDFGTGFFDEADKIALDLFLINQRQKN
jgi:predicted ATPase